MFSMVNIKFNIAFVNSITSCFAKNLGHQYTKVVKTILHYLKNSRK